MGLICLLAGILCLIYYVVLLSVGMDFAILWLGGAVVLIGSTVLVKLGRWKLPLGGKIGIGLVLGAALIGFLVVQVLIFRGMFAKGRPGLDYLVVLGAQVRGDEPSRALKKRLDTAISYLEENPDTQVVVSGGKGSGEDISEAEAMKTYLVENGIAGERILEENQSTNTVENLQYTAELIDRRASIGIVTSNFHVFRSLGLAKKQGYQDVCGLAAPSDPLYQPHYLVRESLAVVKEWVFHNM